jgi:hypothetical protein
MIKTKWFIALLESVLVAGVSLYPAVAKAQTGDTEGGTSVSPATKEEVTLSPISQEQVALATTPRVFLDCQGQLPCDRNHFRTEIRFVNWAQDRADADVHVIATSQMVGGGGRMITLDFIGRGGMEALTDKLTYTSSGTDVQNETLNGVTQILRIGLMRYAVQSGLADKFEVRFTEDTPAAAGAPTGRARPTAATPARDPWNSWTFRVGVSGNMSLRETSTNIRINPNWGADRVTEDWKLGFGMNVNVQRNSRTLSNGRKIEDDRNDWQLDGQIVRSVSDHFSFGLDFGGANSVTQNRDARVEVGPAVEYNYFPYMEANRRQLILQYAATLEHSDYMEETIFNQFKETRPQQSMLLRYNARETWGNAGVGMNYSQYLGDKGLYRAGLNGNMNLRITRGLDLNLNGMASWVHDEIHIPLSAISDEDILLGRQNLPSTYQYNGSVGISYRWGSSFTNVVNTRFSGQQGGPGGGGGGGGF